MGPQHLGKSGVIERPAANDTLAQQLCRSQLIRNSGQVQSFSMLGIVLILTLGGFILVTSVTMESIVGKLQRRFGVGEVRLLNWVMDEKLQLIAMSEQADMSTEEVSKSLSETTVNASVPVTTDEENDLQV